MNNSFKSFRIFLLFILIPSLSWGLTFKDGKQVEDRDKPLYVGDGWDWVISCKVDDGAIERDGDIWIFKNGKNGCTGDDRYSGEMLKIHDNKMNALRTEIASKKILPTNRGTYKFETYFSITSQEKYVPDFSIFQVHDGRPDCAPPLMVFIGKRIRLKGSYKIGNDNNPDSECDDMGLKVNNLPTIDILKDGTEYKLTVLVDFDGKGNFQTEVYINDTLERSATYLQPKSKKSKVCGFKKNTNHVYCEDKIIKYYQSKKFSFKHGIYATNMFDITLRSKWNLSEVK